LIVVDQTSTDGTAEYLAEIQQTSPVPVDILTMSRACRGSVAMNHGAKAARGDYLVLLDPTVVVTQGWLEQLIALANSKPQIGMAGPMGNTFPPPQFVDDLVVQAQGEIDRFANQWRSEHRGRWFTVETLSCLCLLVKRKIFEAVSGFHPEIECGTILDEDLSTRVRGLGFELAVARDLFVYRSEDPETDVTLPMRKSGALEEYPKSVMHPPALAAEGRFHPSRRKLRFSLTMIVRDEEANLPECLASVDGLFDEVIVVDTGSRDRTVAIARALGARVFAFPWIDDFSAARNASLAHASGDYVFWLDADDRIEVAEKMRLREIFDRLESSDSAYLVRCVCDSAPSGSGGAVVDHIRLFPLREGIRWTNRVHEQILPALQQAGVAIRRIDVTVRHTGYVDHALRMRKLDRDQRLLMADLAERPGDPFVLFNLGWSALERKDPKTALPYLRASLSASSPTDSITRKLYALIAQAHQKLGEIAPALSACAEGLAIAPGDPELLFREGILRRITGDCSGAEGCWRKILEDPHPHRTFSSMSPGITGHLTRRNLAALAEEDGRCAEAVRLWKEVLLECPNDAHALSEYRRVHERMNAQEFGKR